MSMKYTMQSKARINLFTELNKLLGFKVPMDGLMAIATKRWEIDIIKLDRKLSQNDHEYYYQDATYKGIEISMNKYVKFKYGERAIEIIELLTA